MPPKKVNRLAEEARKRVAFVEAQRVEQERLIEEERIQLAREIEQQKAKEQEIIDRKIMKENRIKAAKQDGTYKTKSEKQKAKQLELFRNRGVSTTAAAATSCSNDAVECDDINPLKCPIMTILGHVDVGKTKLLDKIRHSFIQNSEVCGITQQIGASKINANVIRATGICIPGILMIDTPGHKSFENLRILGTRLCDVVVIIIDIMHGIESQTEESLLHCINNSIPFILAINKIDLLYGWTVDDSASASTSVMDKINNATVQSQFESLMCKINSWFYANHLTPVSFTDYHLETTNREDSVMYVPISAVTGDGINDLLREVALYCQYYLSQKLEKPDTFDGVVMESKKSSSGETSIDLIVKSGTLKVGDMVSLYTIGGNAVTKIAALRMPKDREEMRNTTRYENVLFAEGSCGVKVLLSDTIECVLPGTSVHILNTLRSSSAAASASETHDTSPIQLDSDGVFAIAPTFGQLEAFVAYLRENGVKVSTAMVGSVGKKDIIKFANKGLKKYMHVLCFDIEPSDEIIKFAEESNGIQRIQFHYEKTIYRVLDVFMKSTKIADDERIADLKRRACFPYEIAIVKDQIFRRKNPIIIGVTVTVGELHLNSQLCDQTGKVIGNIQTIRKNDADVLTAVSGETVSISINTELTYDRHLIESTCFYPKITRESLNILKTEFKDYISTSVFEIIKKIKAAQSIA